MTEVIHRDEIQAALRGHGADYVEIRLDDTSTNRIIYGRELGGDRPKPQLRRERAVAG